MPRAAVAAKRKRRVNDPAPNANVGWFGWIHATRCRFTPKTDGNPMDTPEFPPGASQAQEEWHMSLLFWCVLIGLVALGALSSGPWAKAAPSLVGTLTCTAEAAPSEAKQLGG